MLSQSAPSPENLMTVFNDSFIAHVAKLEKFLQEPFARGVIAMLKGENSFLPDYYFGKGILVDNVLHKAPVEKVKELLYLLLDNDMYFAESIVRSYPALQTIIFQQTETLPLSVELSLTILKGLLASPLSSSETINPVSVPAPVFTSPLPILGKRTRDEDVSRASKRPRLLEKENVISLEEANRFMIRISRATNRDEWQENENMRLAFVGHTWEERSVNLKVPVEYLRQALLKLYANPNGIFFEILDGNKLLHRYLNGQVIAHFQLPDKFVKNTLLVFCRGTPLFIKEVLEVYVNVGILSQVYDKLQAMQPPIGKSILQLFQDRLAKINEKSNPLYVFTSKWPASLTSLSSNFKQRMAFFLNRLRAGDDACVLWNECPDIRVAFKTWSQALPIPTIQQLHEVFLISLRNDGVIRDVILANNDFQEYLVGELVQGRRLEEEEKQHIVEEIYKTPITMFKKIISQYNVRPLWWLNIELQKRPVLIESQSDNLERMKWISDTLATKSAEYNQHLAPILNRSSADFVALMRSVSPIVLALLRIKFNYCSGEMVKEKSNLLMTLIEQQSLLSTVPIPPPSTTTTASTTAILSRLVPTETVVETAQSEVALTPLTNPVPAAAVSAEEYFLPHSPPLLADMADLADDSWVNAFTV